MRLLRLDAGNTLTLTEDLVRNIPPYAILSHIWGDGEVLLQDIRSNVFQEKLGYRKILFCGEQARRDELEYFWVDTCCIDKSSSAELSEAINSMYRWYQNAAKCYAYLSDVSTTCDRPPHSSWLSQFQESRWFTRGWTLQELIAPPTVEFYSREGEKLGDKTSLEDTIHSITNLPILALRGRWKSEIEIPTRISWANHRETTRPEDKAYSLLGLVGVSMPAIYGEGEEEAFIRLGREVIQRYSKYSDQTLLTLTAQCGHAAALHILIERGENIEAKDRNGFSSLIHAARENHESIIQVLLDKGADIESRSNLGNSPLATAVWHGHEKATRILLDQGANIESKNNTGGSPLAHAAWNGHKGIIRVLLDQDADTESKANDGTSPLGHAAWKGHEETARILLDHGANIESKDKDGNSPLAHAAWEGHEALTRMLLNQGADIESINNDGSSPLSYAAWRGHKKLVQMFLDRGANIESKDNDGDSPLACAVWEGHAEVVRMLLDQGADIGSKNKDGDSPLNYAARKGREGIIMLLQREIQARAELHEHPQAPTPAFGGGGSGWQPEDENIW